MFILFPDGLSALPRSQFFLHDVSRGSPDRVIIIPPEHSLMDEASVTDTGSAIILPRDDSRWCPEHFSGLTISDYEECIWLFRLHYGSNGHQLSIRGAEIGWDQEPIDNSRAPDQASTFVSHSIRERLQIRYRNAVCILAGRELAVQGPWKETVYPGSRAAWIRQECGPALAADVEVV
ncbi:hypothetical protein FRB98_007333 [Tulasnella sp. 332]|nr:hypothetical protein FRB98_007333 [Tulasnella sp. 332]